MGDLTSSTPYSTLQRFARDTRKPPRAARSSPWEPCGLCAEPIPPTHRHLVDVSRRQITCVCQACAILFSRPEASDGRYVLVPDRVLSLENFRLDDALWEQLRLPVALAFFFRSTPTDTWVACYPSPLGPTEALVEPSSWEELVRANPVLKDMRPDVEALLINRAHDARQHFLVPIDECYSLVGLIRTSWRGFTGGQEVWEAIARFFEALRERSVAARAEGELL